MSRAHPRSRGENWVRLSCPGSATGSSPLTRGKRQVRRCSLGLLGLIPAHAGKTSRGADMRGRIAGSSPLTRGKHLCPVSRPPLPGLIPAHAGKTLTSQPRSWARPAHPRSRGENDRVDRLAINHVGSSPLTRGKLVSLATLDPSRGLIPAHAGKTQGITARPHFGTAHPRSRGENDSRPNAFMTPFGSSPLTRGKLGVLVSCLIDPGLIPAHAGKTRPTRSTPTPWTAHPRSRGENGVALA